MTSVEHQQQQHRDLSSLSNPHQVCVTHLDWKVRVDFEARIFRATATYALKRVDEACGVLQLDTAELKILKVTDATAGANLSFELKDPVENKPHLGQQLEIALPNAASFLNSNKVTIVYETTQASSAIQWLPPAQTAGKVHPYLFTQCQAIHARSMLPCQDQPGVKMTYEAAVTVPDWAVCVMSGLLQKQKAANDDGSKKTTFVWKQPVPVSSYLIALAVGELAKKDISDRCAIWSEPALVEAAAYEFAASEDFLKTAEDLAGMSYVWGRYDLLCLPPSFPYGGMENPCLTFVTPTLLAGDRSLADVVAHEIAHSWTGNLVTNATWDHFWLNEGWTTWFQRKIMARIHKDDKFLDFDALGGYKTLEDTIKREMPADFQKLVLPIGDQDPDEAYSSIAYEKGFNLLMVLERRVGKDKFEAFFKAYIKEFARKTLTSNDFKEFFLKHFDRNSAVKDIDWDRWFFEPGMPPETPNFDRSLAEASELLADGWIDFDRNGTAAPTADIKSWSSNQITCFLDALQVRSADQPLKCSTLKEMDEHYNLAHSKNAEILFRFCQISIASEDETMLMIIIYFITTQGRMKYVRPLYRALYASKMGKKLAVIAFLQNKDFYHPICAKMIASDLKLAEGASWWSVKGKEVLKWAAVAGAVAAAVGFVLSRRRK